MPGSSSLSLPADQAERMAALLPGTYAVAWRSGSRRSPGRWVQRQVLEIVFLLGHERVTFDELDPVRSGQPPRSSCRRVALARWAEHVLPGPVPSTRCLRKAPPRVADALVG